MPRFPAHGRLWLMMLTDDGLLTFSVALKLYLAKWTDYIACCAFPSTVYTYQPHRVVSGRIEDRNERSACLEPGLEHERLTICRGLCRLPPSVLDSEGGERLQI